MDSTLILLILALVFGFYMAWNIGANDVANAMGTSVGSGALTLKKALLVAAVFEFLGAYFVGSHVAQTISKGIFDPTLIHDPRVLAIGMIASLLASGMWLQLASYFGWPVSTTHTIVGAVAGFGAVVVGVRHEHWSELEQIVASWVVTPVLAGAISYLLFRFIRRQVFYQPDPVAAAKRLAPYLVFIVVCVLVVVTSIEALENFWARQGVSPTHGLGLAITAGSAAVIGTISALIGRELVNRIPDEPSLAPDRFETVYVARSLDKAIKHLRRVDELAKGPARDQARRLLSEVRQLSEQAQAQTDPELTRSAYRKVEHVFGYLQILSACFVAFAHGANDVANAIGPLAAAVQALNGGIVAVSAEIPDWALILGGVGIVVGLATWGWRVMETIGRRITELTPSRGFSAEFGAAITILTASLMGLPISTTHTLVGAVLGVGLARGIGAINLRTIRDIVASWVVTIPAGAALAILFYFILEMIFL